MRKTSLAVLISVAAACGDQGSDVPPESLRARQLAARYACIGEELARDAQEDVVALEETLGAAGATASAATLFARAFAQHAQLRSAAYAQTDSALNRSDSPRDSTQHMRAAGQFQIRTPRAGTLEANVIESYDRKVAAFLSDADHPCNWKHELDE